MSHDETPERWAFPRTGGNAISEDGINNEHYIDKRDLDPRQLVVRDGFAPPRKILNQLPPGQDIEDQDVSTARRTARMPFKQWAGWTSYPGDGGFPRSPGRK